MSLYYSTRKKNKHQSKTFLLGGQCFHEKKIGNIISAFSVSPGLSKMFSAQLLNKVSDICPKPLTEHYSFLSSFLILE